MFNSWDFPIFDCVHFFNIRKKSEFQIVNLYTRIINKTEERKMNVIPDKLTYFRVIKVNIKIWNYFFLHQNLFVIYYNCTTIYQQDASLETLAW